MAFGLTPWDPFRELDRLDRLVRRSFDTPFARTETLGAPAVEISDEGDHYLVKAEIPGVSEDDVEITLSGNLLTIRGEKRYERKAGAGDKQAAEAAEAEEAESRPIFSEVFYGRFERVLTLPDDIDPARVDARAKNGVYSIEIGKKAEQKARRINVTRH